MRAKEIVQLGIPKGEPLNQAINSLRKMRIKKGEARQILQSLSDNPQAFLDDPDWGNVAASILYIQESKSTYQPRETIAPYKVWGLENIDPETTAQIVNACMLPIAVSGALMPDAHVGYGLPIGGVLATDNAVIPYAVGVDIACRMKLSVFDAPISLINIKRNKLTEAIEKETGFGVGVSFNPRKDHAVMEEGWDFCKLIKGLKDLAWSQLGTSGSGNHFAEFGVYYSSIEPEKTYLAFLTHSGSRRSGGDVCDHYHNIAKERHPELPKSLINLSWLDMDSDAGQEYWQAMNLMGKYAAANHELIHEGIKNRLGFELVLNVENHHNFAWKEIHSGKEVIVHRKGATPAGLNDVGIIPGSMGTPGYIVKGKGVVDSLNSASHGAGRRMSRKEAKSKFTDNEMKKFLEKNQVTLITGGLDECPQAYKDIDKVMESQKDLVEITGTFLPRLVKMSPE